jgi:ubiquinone/menaquinone biosynthesis C-methylase UbiE
VKTAAQQSKARTPWYVRAFEKDYLKRYPHRTDAAAKKEAQFAASILKLPRGATVLDLCCGAGRHSRALAAAGFNVIGVDLSADLLRVARKKGVKGKGRVRYIRADMRSVPLADASVDEVVSMFTSFGYFTAERDNARVLKEVARVLKPGAPFVMDYFNLMPTLANLVAESRRKIGTTDIVERRCFVKDTRRLTKVVEARDGECCELLCESVRAYSPRELKTLFKRAGLRVISLFGDLAGSKFDERRSPRCVVFARKGKGGG